MSKMHISEDGNARPCHASTPEKCTLKPNPNDIYGITGRHFDSQEEVEKFYESIHNGGLASLNKEKEKKDHIHQSDSHGTSSHQQESSDNSDTGQDDDSKENHAFNPTYTINPDDLDKFKKKIDKANQRLKDNGIDDEFTYDVEYEERKKKIGPNLYTYEQFAKVTLNKPVIKQEGYTFEASVTQEEGGMLVRGTRESDLEGWRPSDMSCEHCGQNRERKKVYILKDEEGKKHQVGSSCVSDYLGVKPEGLWALDVDHETFAPSDKTPRFKPMYEPRTLAAVAMALSDSGENYIGSQSQGVSTASEVDAYFNPPSPQGRGYEARRKAQEENERRAQKVEKYLADPENAKKIDDAMNAVKNMNRGDYAENMKTIFNSSKVSGKSFNYAVSAAAVYNRAQRDNQRTQQWAEEKKTREEKRAQEVKQYTTGYLGNEGDSVKGTSATFVGMRNTSMTDMRGNPVKAITMKSADNKQVVWFTATPDNEFKEGDEIEITAGSVKRQGHYNGIDQTIITRAKIIDKHTLNTSNNVREAMKKSRLTKNFKNGRGQNDKDYVITPASTEDGYAMSFSKDKETGEFSILKYHIHDKFDNGLVFKGSESDGYEFMKNAIKNNESVSNMKSID